MRECAAVTLGQKSLCFIVFGQVFGPPTARFDCAPSSCVTVTIAVISLRVCVCVTLGIIGILSDFLAGGHGTRLQTVSNKAMQSGGISSLASWTYLQFSFFSAWHEAKPRTSLGTDKYGPSSPCHFVVALRLWPPFLLRPPGFDGPYWYS